MNLVLLQLGHFIDIFSILTTILFYGLKKITESITFYKVNFKIIETKHIFNSPKKKKLN